MKPEFTKAIIAAVLILFGVEAYGSRCTSLLDDLSHRSSSVVLPQKKLVHLYQQEGIDPFRLFQEGMDPENENPLSISNKDGKLTVNVGGFAYQAGKDGSAKYEIEALEFSESSQRYYLRAKGDGFKYRLLINVDRKAQVAKVWMKEKKKGEWSEWELAAVYASEQAILDQALSQVAAPEKISQPRVAAPIAPTKATEPSRTLSAGAASVLGAFPPPELPVRQAEPSQNETTKAEKVYEGFLGDNSERDFKQLVTISESHGTYYLNVINGDIPFHGFVIRMKISQDVADAIGDGNIEKLNGVKYEDHESGAIVEFIKRGQTFDGKPKIQIKAQSSDEKVQINSALPWKPQRVYLN